MFDQKQKNQNKKALQVSQIQGDHPILLDLKKAEDAGAHLLIPTFVEAGIQGALTPVIEVVRLSSDEKDGDIYQNKKIQGAYMITAQGLSKLGNCANIEWNHSASKITNRDKDYVSYAAVGGIRKADGKLFEVIGEADLDMLVAEEEIKERNRLSQYGNDEKAAKEIAQVRKYMLPATQTKAQNRVIRKLLGVKSKYQQQDFDKPFVVLRFSYQPDLSNPELAKIMMQEFIGSKASIYDAPPAQTLTENVDPGAESSQPSGDTPETSDEDLTPEQLREKQIKLFLSYNEEKQIDVIKKGMKKTGYNKTLQKPLSEFEDVHRLGFFKLLLDREAAQNEEIPY